MILLGIETSCDETSAAILDGPRTVLSSVVSSQVEHLEYGGVVPELAARAHLRLLRPIVRMALDQAGIALDDVEGVAATQGPGLMGALLVGFGFARAVAWARNRPFAAVNHLEGHLLSPLLTDAGFEPPFLALLVSGGHTELVRSPEWLRYEMLGSTVDDAVGEAFDKVSILLGLGYPGGPAIDRAAAAGRADAWPFPRARLAPGSLDFSFSGLKTAVRTVVERRRGELGLGPADRLRPPNRRTWRPRSRLPRWVPCWPGSTRRSQPTRRHGWFRGRRAANSALREGARALCERRGVAFHVPPSVTAATTPP
jgi:N6-L-threonylcarbamoyladenine synthase